MKSVKPAVPKGNRRDDRLSEALDRYRGHIWKNCNRFGHQWAEDAYQQMVTKALSRSDLLDKDIDALGRKLGYMALTEAAHMARSQKRRDAAVDSLGVSSAKSESFEEPILSLDAWLDVVSRVSDEKALVFSLKMQGHEEGEIADSVGVPRERVKRVVRDVNRAIDEVLLHQDAGICSEQAGLLDAYIQDLNSPRGAGKALDRRVRSRLKSHMELCDVCRSYTKGARKGVGQLMSAAFPAHPLIVDQTGSSSWLAPINSLLDTAGGMADKVKVYAHFLIGRTEQFGQAATTASASGLGPGRIATTCSAAAACLAFGVAQGAPEVKRVLVDTKALKGSASEAKKPEEVPRFVSKPEVGQVGPNNLQGLPRRSEPSSNSEKPSGHGSGKGGDGKDKGEPVARAADRNAPQAKGTKAAPESSGGAEFSPDSLGAQRAPGG